MKICRAIQITLLVLVGAMLFLIGPSNFKDSNKVWAINTDALGVHLGQPRYYEHSSRAYFRFYVSPGRPYYYGPSPYYYYYNYPNRYYSSRSEVYLTVREDPNSNERVRDVYLDNYRVNLDSPSSRGNRGTFTYRLSPGSHVVEWTIEKSFGRSQNFSRQFSVDGYGNPINLVIDGDEFYRN